MSLVEQVRRVTPIIPDDGCCELFLLVQVHVQSANQCHHNARPELILFSVTNLKKIIIWFVTFN